ncbi:MAG TPA: hypothetical protein VG015_01830 [Candidatus Dormibacteraeota bacterium]|nr:hypothetical protein [Candidatus Dormibacteraeota bacterium]
METRSQFAAGRGLLTPGISPTPEAPRRGLLPVLEALAAAQCRRKRLSRILGPIESIAWTLGLSLLMLVVVGSLVTFR